MKRKRTALVSNAEYIVLNDMEYFLSLRWSGNLSARFRLVASLLVALGVALAVGGQLQDETHVVITWDAFALCILLLSWLAIFTTEPARIRQLAAMEDGSRTLTFILVIVAAFASLVAVLLLLRDAKHGMNSGEAAMHLILSALAVICSWLLTHTMFTLRYAHIFYSGSQESGPVRGLDFPGEKNPDYLDFAYFSFIIGMTGQVSDVAVSSRRLRRLVLLHGMLSFAFNTVVLALSVSAVASLL